MVLRQHPALTGLLLITLQSLASVQVSADEPPSVFCRTAEAEAAKAEAERLAEEMAAERERLADLEAANVRLVKHVQVGIPTYQTRRVFPLYSCLNPEP